jgi:hypothetical protein
LFQEVLTMDNVQRPAQPDAAIIADALRSSHHVDEEEVLEGADNYPVTNRDVGDEFNDPDDPTQEIYDRGVAADAEDQGVTGNQPGAGTWGMGGGLYNRGTDTSNDQGFGHGSGTSPGSYGSGGSGNQ